MQNASIGRMNRIIANISLEQRGYFLHILLIKILESDLSFQSLVDGSPPHACLPEKLQAAGRSLQCWKSERKNFFLKLFSYFKDSR